MKSRNTVVICGFYMILVSPLLFADVHPRAVEIQSYLHANPIEPRIPELLALVSPASMEYNRQGYLAYESGEYEKAVALFEKAADEDRKNSFAWYNAASSIGLRLAEDASADADIVKAGDYLSSAVKWERYWGAKLMVDSDLDHVRKVDMGGKSFFEPAPVDTAYIHELNDDGTCELYFWEDDLSGMGSPSTSLVTTGWYCAIGETVIEFFLDPSPKFPGAAMGNDNGVYAFHTGMFSKR